MVSRRWAQRASSAARPLAAALLLSCLPAGAALAQPSLVDTDIVAVVNGNPVTHYDLNARLRLIVFSARMQPQQGMPETIVFRGLQTLIDEMLQEQEASANGIVITDGEVDARMAAMEKANNMPPGELPNLLRSQGIDPETLRARLRGALAWSGLVDQRFRGQKLVSDAEVDARLAWLQQRPGETQKRLQEIFLPFGALESARTVAETARLLAVQLGAGADFNELVHVFSESPSAFNNGDRGWVVAADLPPELVPVITATPVGGLTGPVAAGGGYYLVKVTGARQIAATGASAGDIRQLRIPYGPGVDGQAQTRQEAIEQALQLREAASGCGDLAVRPPASEVRQVSQAAIPPAARGQVATLKPGEVTAPVLTDGAVLLFTVCQLADTAGHMIDREEVAAQLWQSRLAGLLRQYTRELRQKAIIDQRI